MPRSLTNAYWIHVGEVREQMRILELLDDDSPIWDDPRGTQAALIAAIKDDH